MDEIMLTGFFDELEKNAGLFNFLSKGLNMLRVASKIGPGKFVQNIGRMNKAIGPWRTFKHLSPAIAVGGTGLLAAHDVARQIF